MNKIYLSFISIILMVLTITGCGTSETSDQSDADINPDQTTLAGISLNVNDAIINFGDKITITVYKNYDDGGTESFNSVDTISWSVDTSVIQPDNVLDKSVETFSTKNTRGVTDVEVTYIDAETNTTYKTKTTVTVNPVYLRTDVLPDSFLIPPDFFIRYKAVEIYSDGINADITDTVTWDVLDSTIGDINASGISGGFVALKPGLTQISAMQGSEIVSVPVEVVPTRAIGAEGSVFSPPNSLMHNASVVIDGLNNATAVYGYQASGELISAGHDGTGWTPPIQINATQSPTDIITSEKLASNDAGARFVAWEGLDNLYAAYAKPGEGFGPTMVVPVTDSGIIEIIVTNTNEVIIYYGAFDVDYKLMTSKFDPALVSWSTPKEIDWSAYTETASDLVDGMSFNTNGDAILYWDIVSASGRENYVAIFHNNAGVDGGVQTPKLIYSTSDIYEPAIIDVDFSINDNRDAVIAWSVGAENARLVYALRYTDVDNWGVIRSLTMGSGVDAITIKTAINETGSILIGWVSEHIVQGIGGSSLHVNRYTNIDGWSIASEITNNNVQGTLRIYSLTVLDNNNAICIYDGRSFVATPHAYRLYIEGEGWKDEVILEHIGIIGNTNDSLKVSYNKLGKGVITWAEGNLLPFPDGNYYTANYNFLELAPNIE